MTSMDERLERTALCDAFEALFLEFVGPDAEAVAQSRACIGRACALTSRSLHSPGIPLALSEDACVSLDETVATELNRLLRESAHVLGTEAHADIVVGADDRLAEKLARVRASEITNRNGGHRDAAWGGSSQSADALAEYWKMTTLGGPSASSERSREICVLCKRPGYAFYTEEEIARIRLRFPMLAEVYDRKYAVDAVPGSGIDFGECFGFDVAVRGPFRISGRSKQLLYAHDCCLMWAPNVYEDERGLVHNAEVEITRSARLQCAHCHKPGAAVGCRYTGCRKSFHLPCSLLADNVCALYSNDYALYCSGHARKGCNGDLPLHQLRCHETRTWIRSRPRPPMRSRLSTGMQWGVSLGRERGAGPRRCHRMRAAVFLRRSLRPYELDDRSSEAEPHSSFLQMERKHASDSAILSMDVGDSGDEATPGVRFEEHIIGSPQQSLPDLLEKKEIEADKHLVVADNLLISPASLWSMFATLRGNAAEAYETGEHHYLASDEDSDDEGTDADPFSVAHAFL